MKLGIKGANNLASFQLNALSCAKGMGIKEANNLASFQLNALSSARDIKAPNTKEPRSVSGVFCI